MNATRETPVRNTPERALRMQQSLAAAPQTYDQLVLVSGLQKPAVAHWVKAVRAAGGLHVAAWAQDSKGRWFTPVFRWGKGVDVDRPVGAKSAAERMAQMRARKKAAQKGGAS